MSSRPVLALDLGGTQIRAAVVLPDGARRARHAVSTPISDGPDAIVEACVQTLSQTREGAGQELANAIVGIGISSAGPVDPKRGVVLEPPNLGPAFRDIALTARIGPALGLPAVLDRDTNVAALGERAFGAGRDCDDFVYLTVSTGVGGGVVAGRKLFHGPDGLAGELGHVPVALDESIASGRALARDAAAVVSGESPFGQSPFLDARAAAIGRDQLSARDVAAGEEARDPACIRLMDRARRAIAVACVGFVNTFNPHRIIIGGAIARAQGERLLQPVRAAILAEAFSVAAARVTVVGPELGSDVSLAGAHPLVHGRIQEGDPAFPTSATVATIATTVATPKSGAPGEAKTGDQTGSRTTRIPSAIVPSP
ncbi:MAG: ROK family protein [Candidatus Limnocylindrales bacterium]